MLHGMTASATIPVPKSPPASPPHLSVEVLDYVPTRGLGCRGAWSPLIAQLERLGPEKSLRITPKLTKAQAWSARSAARYRGWGLHLRHTVEGTMVWLGKRCRPVAR
jgi:hypothetical protein